LLAPFDLRPLAARFAPEDAREQGRWGGAPAGGVLPSAPSAVRVNPNDVQTFNVESKNKLWLTIKHDLGKYI
jgi:hypothetical protein